MRGKEDESQARQVGGDFCLFASNVSGANRQCVLDSMLFSELAANCKVSAVKDENSVDWYNAYCDVLLYLGLPSMSFTFRQVKIELGSFSFKPAFLNILTDLISIRFFGTLWGMKALEDVSKAIDALKTRDNYSEIYSHFHNKARKNAFTIGLVNQDPNHDTPIMSLFAFEMDVEAKELTVLWNRKRSSSADLKSAGVQAILDKNIFKGLQSTVQKRLGNKLSHYVKDIPLDN